MRTLKNLDILRTESRERENEWKFRGMLSKVLGVGSGEWELSTRLNRRIFAKSLSLSERIAGGFWFHVSLYKCHALTDHISGAQKEIQTISTLLEVSLRLTLNSYSIEIFTRSSIKFIKSTFNQKLNMFFSWKDLHQRSKKPHSRVFGSMLKCFHPELGHRVHCRIHCQTVCLGDPSLKCWSWA